MTGMMENNNSAHSSSSVVYSGEFNTSVAMFNIVCYTSAGLLVYSYILSIF